MTDWGRLLYLNSFPFALFLFVFQEKSIALHWLLVYRVSKNPWGNIMAVGLVTQCYNVAFPESSESSVLSDSLLFPTLPFIAIAIPRFYYFLQDLTASQRMTSSSTHRKRKKKKIKAPRWEFHVLYGNSMNIKNHLYWFSLSLFLGNDVSVLLLKNNHFTFVLDPLDSFTLLHRFSLVFCSFYIFISTDYFLFCILQTYFNFPCLKK